MDLSKELTELNLYTFKFSNLPDRRHVKSPLAGTVGILPSHWDTKKRLSFFFLRGYTTVTCEKIDFFFLKKNYVFSAFQRDYSRRVLSKGSRRPNDYR